ncbi:MAG: hypothetical protein CMJ59_24260, partial [Planctomycetaceae bacterium]|nr:hypothetical protein [Planctomycetaceae bacterium]
MCRWPYPTVVDEDGTSHLAAGRTLGEPRDSKEDPGGPPVTCPGDRTRVRVDHDSAAREILTAAPESVGAGDTGTAADG